MRIFHTQNPKSPQNPILPPATEPTFVRDLNRNPSKSASEPLSADHYLTTEPAQVFWVVNAKRGITSLDMSFYRDYLSGRCDDLVVTRSDYFRQPGSKDEFQKLYTPLFDAAPPLFHFVSGQSACDGLSDHGLPANVLQQRLEAAGTLAIEDRIRALRNEAGQRQVLEARLRDLAAEIGQFLLDFRDAHGQTLRYTWKPSLWENAWQNADDPLRRELAALMAASNHQVTCTRHI